MQEQVKKRLTELQAEFNKGQQKLQELENETAQLRNTLLRISGAIQVLKELSSPAASQQNGQPQTKESFTENHSS